MPLAATYDIFMDGSCSFCKWTRTKVEPYDTRARLRFLDYNDPGIATQSPFSRDALDREMHVRTPDGKWLKGFEAWVALLRDSRPQAEVTHPPVLRDTIFGP
jgi:predicted DCC family thiol-disulfide oxidoreductase YuxK